MSENVTYILQQDVKEIDMITYIFINKLKHRLILTNKHCDTFANKFSSIALKAFLNVITSFVRKVFRCSYF